MHVNVTYGAAGRYANIKSNGCDMQVRLVGGDTDSDALRIHEAELRAKADRLLKNADIVAKAAAYMQR